MQEKGRLEAAAVKSQYTEELELPGTWAVRARFALDALAYCLVEDGDSDMAAVMSAEKKRVELPV